MPQEYLNCDWYSGPQFFRFSIQEAWSWIQKAHVIYLLEGQTKCGSWKNDKKLDKSLYKKGSSPSPPPPAPILEKGYDLERAVLEAVR